MMSTRAKTRQLLDESSSAKPETDLLVQTARVSIDAGGLDRIRDLTARELNWDQLLSLALRNGLLPLLSFHLNHISGVTVPPERSRFMRDYFEKNSAFNLLMSGELLRILKVFELQGIRAQPYKGPAMAVRLYGNLSLRQFCDLDILVREKDVWRATELLTAEGFEPHFDIPTRKQEAFIRLGYVRLFRRDGGRTLIELHWRTAPRFFGVRLDADGLWQRLETIKILGTDVLSPSPEDLLLMLCVHGAKDSWERLEWVAGIAELLRNTPEMNWEEVWVRGRQMGCEGMLLLGLLLSYDLLDAPLPAGALDRIRKSRKLSTIGGDIAGKFFSQERPTFGFSARLAFHLALKDTTRDKLRYCSRLALTTTPVDWAMPVPRAFSFAYPLLRAARLTRKYVFTGK